MDPGHFEPNAKLKAMDRDGVFAEVIFPEVAGAKLINPHLMGDDWKGVFVGYNNAMADFAAVDPVRLMTAYQLPLRSEEHTSELQSLMRISYAVFCLTKKTHNNNTIHQ